MNSLYKINGQNKLKLIDSFLNIRINISDENLVKLIQTQRDICDKLDWIEMDQGRLTKIIEMFIDSGYLHEENYMFILKRIIIIYYKLRVKLDYHSSDQEILQTLFDQYCKGARLYVFEHVDKQLISMELAHQYKYGFNDEQFKNFQKETERILLKQGGKIRDDKSIYY